MKTRLIHKGPAIFAVVFCIFFQVFTGTALAEGLLVIRVEGRDFERAVEGVRGEVEDEFPIFEMIIDKSTGQNKIVRKIEETSPKAVILMDNVAISKFKKFQSESGSSVPTVSLMASFMDLAIGDMDNATGIFYEVPVVTSVVYLRSVLRKPPLRKIGVVHRRFMEPSVEMNRKYCEKEKIKLISHSVPNKGNFKSEIEKGLSNLDEEHDIDALWIPNDSRLITAKLLKSVWMPFAKRFKKPVFVGVEILVQPKFEFGTFAVIPDPLELGAQAAEMVFEIMDAGWEVEENGAVPPRSVYKIINFEQADRLFDVDDEKLASINKILK